MTGFPIVEALPLSSLARLSLALYLPDTTSGSLFSLRRLGFLLPSLLLLVRYRLRRNLLRVLHR